MDFGFVKVGAYTPEVKVADIAFNTEQIKKGIELSEKEGIELVVFPEMCLTAYTILDIVYSDVLLDGAIKALKDIADFSKDKNMLIFIGMPYKKDNLIYNVSAVINNGRVLAFIPKQNLKNYNDCYEKRYFSPCDNKNSTVNFDGYQVLFGNKVILAEKNQKNFTVSAEIGYDLFAVSSPSVSHSLNGANIIVNLACSSETVGAKEYKENSVKEQSKKLACAYVYTEAGEGESTTDGVCSGRRIISECGKILSTSEPFTTGLITKEIDVDFIAFERLKAFNGIDKTCDGYDKIEFNAFSKAKNLRKYKRLPFVPENSDICRAELILNIQAEALKKRISHTNSKSVVLGLSGGLDSTLAIIVAVTAMQKLNRSLKDVIAVTMPCFGTTSRTYLNTISLAKALGVTLKKVDITKAVIVHLKDIKHDKELLDVTYENAQARERTQVIMDIANMNGGLVVGTGDLSEVALGWSTYNGDHMSMYGVNCSIPKTLVRLLVDYYANNSKGKLKTVLKDILDTPVSPELLPAENGEIKQKTEDIVGPYVLHDFYLYHFIRRGSSPKKIFYIASNTFEGEFSQKEILKWLKTFVRRFFTQQFKRSCVPDGVKVGSVALSPRGDWKMPSDAVFSLYLEELESINI